jgi:hypothetical protein
VLCKVIETDAGFIAGGFYTQNKMLRAHEAEFTTLTRPIFPCRLGKPQRT